MRLLGVDFGSKRIGLAVGEAEHGIASPRAALESKRGLKANVAPLLDAAAREEAQSVVFGIPYLEDRKESEMTRVCLQMARLLRDAGLEVVEVDESLTSVAAEDRLRNLDWTAAQRDRHKDSEAACLLLERFFSEHGKTKA